MPNTANAPGSYDSLESLHDAIHGLIGNGGHFTYVSHWILGDLSSPYIGKF